MTSTTLQNELKARYGVTLAQANPISLLWAAERIVDTIGLEAAQNELSAANRQRERNGQMGGYPEYGTRLFNRVSDKRKASARKAAATRARRRANRPAWMQ